MWRTLIIAGGLIVAATFQVSAGQNLPTGQYEVDLKEATGRFKDIFERTCYRHRHALGKLITDRPSPEFEKIPRQYPIRDEAQKSTILAEWGMWSQGVPYKIGLFQLDSSPDITTCSLFSLYMQKSNLTKSILDIDGLDVFKYFEENEHNCAAIESKNEPNLRIICAAPKTEQLHDGFCQLWLWQGSES
jgi:hypothetical protein